MRRRGEGPFVAAPLGFWNDSKLLALAQRLRVAPGLAGSFVLRWEQFVLRVGDARTGRVKDYSPLHLTVELGWRGKPGRLLAGLKEAGVLRAQRGTLLHPYWAETITGQYAIRRAKDRERPRGRSADDPRNVHGDSADDPRKSGDQSIKAGAPPAPPAGGGDLGATRWQWLRDNAPNPQNPARSALYAAALPDEEWALVVEAYGALEGGRGPLSREKRRALSWPTYKFLLQRAFLQFRRKTPPKGQQPKVAADPAAKERDAGTARDFLLAQLADPELEPDRKRKAVERWNANHPDDQLPLPG